MQRLIIVGGGFAGFWAAVGAADARRAAGAGAAIEIDLVSADRDLTIRPRLHEDRLPDAAARAPLDPACGAIGVRLVQATVESLLPEQRRIGLRQPDGRRAEAVGDAMIMALGSRMRWPAIEGAREYGWSVDDHPSAAALQRHLDELPRQSDGEGRATVAVIGGGFTGIEVAAEMPARLARVFAGRPDRPRVVLLDRAGDIPANLGAAPRPAIAAALDGLGIECWPGVEVVRVDAGGLELADGRRLATRTVVVCAGFEAHPMAAAVPGRRDRLGRIAVDATLALPGTDRLFAAGDIAVAPLPDGHATVMSCQHAISMGAAAGRNAVRALLGLATEPYAPTPYMTCLDLGPWGALVTGGWDRQVQLAGPDAKPVKQRIVRDLIRPPASGDADDVFALLAPAAGRRRVA